MTAPRQPRHRLADDPDAPGSADTADTPDARDPAAPDEPLTQVLPIIPSQRAAVPQVFPAYPPAAGVPSAPASDSAGPPMGSPAKGSPATGPQRPAAGRGRLPLVLAGVTALVLALGVAVVVVESGAPADAAPVSGE